MSLKHRTGLLAAVTAATLFVILPLPVHTHPSASVAVTELSGVDLAAALPNEVTAPKDTHRGAWVIEGRMGQDMIWFGGWTPGETSAMCESRRRDLQAPDTASWTISPCRYQIVADGPPGTEAWITFSITGFAGGPTEPTCERVAETFRTGHPDRTVPPCQRAWIRTP